MRQDFSPGYNVVHKRRPAGLHRNDCSAHQPLEAASLFCPTKRVCSRTIFEEVGVGFYRTILSGTVSTIQAEAWKKDRRWRHVVQNTNTPNSLPDNDSLVPTDLE